MTQFFSFLLVLVASTFSHALVVEREAWITKSFFDGEYFKYQYTAYDAKRSVQDEVRVNCDYTKYEKELVLKQVEIKILMSGDFTNTGSEIVRNGQVNMKDAMKSCLDKVPGLRKNLKVPVAIVLPQISIPIQQ